MPLTLDPQIEIKLAALKAQRELVLGEVVAVHWPAPDGTKYYGSSKLHTLPNFSNILNHIPDVELRLPGRSFENVVLAADVSDEQINLNLWDADGEITRLFRTHGEGVKLELFYFLPQLHWFVSHWLGHLQPPNEADLIDFSARAASGFRSAGLPVGHRMFQAPCQNQYPPAVPLLTQAEIDQSGCPVNKHIGGAIGTIDPSTGQVWARCAKTEADCIKIVGDKLSHTGFNTTVVAVAIQTHGQTTFAASKGNETTLKQSLRLLYGGPRIVRALDLLAYRQEHNTAHPDQGFLAALFAIGEGPFRSITLFSINQALVGSQHFNVRLGLNRQSPTSYAPNVGNFSYTGCAFGRIGPLNPGGYNASNITAQCTVEGLANIRVYTTPTSYTETYSDLRSWCLLNLYTNWRYGHGMDIVRFVMQDWIDLAAWDAESSSFIDPIGNVWTAPRNKFSADLPGRSAQEQFTDICKFGRYTMPFQHFGSIRILPLRKEPLENVPVFTDEGPEQNILRTEATDAKPNMPRIYWSRESDAVLPNELLITFEDSANGNIERPQTFADERQQLKAGRAYGDATLRIVRKLYSAVGLTVQAQVARVGWLLYHLGEFDTGGTKNNYRVRMFTTFQAGFGLYQSQVIKIDAALVRRSSPSPDRPQGFTYFRVIKKVRHPDLSYEVFCQAYPEDYYDALETAVPYTADGYEAEAEGNTLEGSATVVADPACSNGAKVTDIGNDDGALQFNGITVSSTRLYEIAIYYKSTAARSAYLSINGGASQLLQFPSSGGNVGSITFRKSLTAGIEYRLYFHNPFGPAPDLDVITLEVVYIDPWDPGGTCRVTHGDLVLTDDEISFRIIPPTGCS